MFFFLTINGQKNKEKNKIFFNVDIDIKKE